MRFFLFSVFFSLWFPTVSNAQLSNGTIAPDFTISDIEGNSYTLYDILDQDKIVILDFFATWCGPCWSYSQSKELENIWQTFGPLGTDELFIFYIENDPHTTLGDLHGNGYNTYGDFTAGVSHPIFNDSTLNYSYNINYLPTVYMICPNKRLTEIGQITLPEAEDLIGSSCSSPLGTNNGEILSFKSNLDPFCHSEEYLPNIYFQNAGTNTVTHAKFDVLLNGEVVHEDCIWADTLQSFESTSIEFKPLTLTEASEISVVIKEINGYPDTTPPNNSVTGQKRTPKVHAQPLFLDVKTDNFGYETYWEIKDENGELVASGGNSFAKPGAGQSVNYLTSNPDGFYHPDTLYQHEIFLPYTGCYSISFIDDYGDGICCNYGNGFFHLKDRDGTILFSGDEKFSITALNFENVEELVAVEEVAAGLQFHIFPNPADELLHLQLTEEEANRGIIRVFNSFGKESNHTLAFQHPGGYYQETIDVSDLVPGIYFIQITLGSKSSLQKVFIR